jgi:heme b synthase
MPQAPRAPQGNPRLIFWETTAGCNLRCIHCRRIDVADSVMADDLSTAEARDFIEQIAALPAGAPAGAGAHLPILVLSGGEPLFRPDIFDLARYASDHGITVALATNATLVDGTVARRIAEAGVRRVSVSLDGADPATHDAFRALPGCFDRAVHGIRMIQEAGLPFQINTTVARHNMDQLPRMMDLALKLGAAAFHPFLLVPVGCGVEISGTQMLAPHEYENVLNWLWEEEQKGLLEIKATCAPHYYRIGRQRGRGAPRAVAPNGGASLAGGHSHSLGAHTKGCLAGSGVCFVSHKGEVFPCGYLPVEAGNLRKQSLQEIWQHSPVFARLRDNSLLAGKCGLCEFQNVCGGCRARAYGITGDYLAEEPFCIYQPATRRI